MVCAAGAATGLAGSLFRLIFTQGSDGIQKVAALTAAEHRTTVHSLLGLHHRGLLLALGGIV